jgi:hypothetical protein
MRRKLTDEQVRELHRLSRNGWTSKELGFRFEIATVTVSRILNGRRRADVPTLTLFNLVQFDNESDKARVRWILRPGREIFVVFNQGWIRASDGTDGRSFHPGDRSLAAMAQYTIRV